MRRPYAQIGLKTARVFGRRCRLSQEEAITWFYDAKTGESRVAGPDEVASGANSTNDSARDEIKLETRSGRLIAVDPKNGTEITLVSSPVDREVEFRNPTWSPDRSKVLFIEADYSAVKQRWVLVPGDPSYPEVQQNRFARVGGEIERLRIGVVSNKGDGLIWLPVDCPAEGMYLGQVEWAGNSDEVLVERFSRFRDQRDFLLIKVGGDVRTIYSESDNAWVESSQGKNSGLAWIRDGSEFVVISEKDGWRHAYRYCARRQAIALLTPGDYDIIERAVIDEAGGWY